MTIDRRTFLGSMSAFGIAAAVPARAKNLEPSAPSELTEDKFFAGTAHDGGFTYRTTNMQAINPIYRRQLVHYQHEEMPGTIIVDTKHYFLYSTFENNTALRYGVGVGKEGFKWYGRAQINRKEVWPGWTPPPEMLVRRPELPKHMDGGPNNPLGPRAMYLYRDGRDLGYRLHGTVEPWSIGGDVSSGCIRMLPEDVMDLFQRSPIGTKVLVLERLA